MLTRLAVRDFALIEHQEISLGPGFTVITGETGAGKSILIDALGLVLGDRADAGFIRHGAERADITAVFDLSKLPAARQWLTERDLGLTDDECQIRRVIGEQGRSRAYINGVPQPVQTLAELGERLVNIHGQHAHQTLGKMQEQRRLLDGYAGNGDLLAEVATRYRRWQDARRQLDTVSRGSAETDARRDLLTFQVGELDDLALQADELPALDAEQRLLASAGQRLASGAAAIDVLYENETASAYALITRAQDLVAELTDLDPRLSGVGEMLESALIQVQEAADTVRHLTQDVEADPERQSWVEARLDTALRLARKHQVPAEELADHHRRLKSELAGLDSSEDRIAALAQDCAKAEAAYRESAAALSAARTRAGSDLAGRIVREMAELGMSGGRFVIALTALDAATEHGLDGVEFQVSTNPGQPPKSLAKVASGGELARISLAIQVITARQAEIPTLIFDEVDSGVGGGVAEVVGRELRTLAATRQVLCVTHLPQVASQGHAHLRVRKSSDGTTTHNTVEGLDADGRTREIARMLGGMTITDSTLAHAAEMLEMAAQG